MTVTYIECTKCCGTGKVQHMHVMGGVCFKCNGSGKARKTKRVLVTTEYFLVENKSLNIKQPFKSVQAANDFIEELEEMWADESEKSTVTPKKSKHYELISV